MPKIASLKNLPAASEKGLYYLESFASKYINGARVLSPTFSFVSTISNNTTGFSSLGTLCGLTALVLNSDSLISSLIGISTDSNIFHYAFLSGTSRGLIHANTDGGVSGDVFTTDKENLLFTGATRLGLGVRGTCKAGSSTTKIVDNDARDLSALGISSSAGHNKVYNLSNGAEYTITSISTTNSSNDTMNFSAGTTNTTGDFFIVFNDLAQNFFTTTAYPQYKSQKTQSSIIHQIRQFDTDYLILNGNYLAALNVNESTWNDNYKQFPNNTEGTCFAVNQAQMLIGASYKGKGRLLLWNGFSDGFLSIIELERAPQAMEAYNNGWVVSIGSDLYFTNGYSLTKLATVPDSDYFGATCTILYNGIKIISDRIYLNATIGGLNRAKTGTWIYDLKGGWSYVPSLNSSGEYLNGQTMGALKSVVSNNQNRIFCSYSTLSPVPNADASLIGRLSDETGYKPSAVIMVPLGAEFNIKGIELSLGIKNVSGRNSSGATATVSVAVGDARRELFRNFSSGSSNTTTTVKNSSAGTQGNAGIVGQQVRLIRGAASGERSYIQSIASPGTSSEVLTVSPAFSAAPSDTTTVSMLNLRSFGSKTITNIVLPERGQLSFYGDGILTDKVFIEISITGTDADLIDIYEVNILG